MHMSLNAQRDSNKKALQSRTPATNDLATHNCPELKQSVPRDLSAQPINRTTADITYLRRIAGLAIFTREEEVKYFGQLNQAKAKAIFFGLDNQFFREKLVARLGRAQKSGPGRGVATFDLKEVHNKIEKLIEQLEQLPKCTSIEQGSLKTSALKLLLELPRRKFNAINFLLDWANREQTTDNTQAKLLGACQEYLDARNFIMTRNLKLVISLSKHFWKADMDVEDIISAGNLGLLRALEKFNISRGNKFSTYAIYYITRFMTVAVRDESRTVRMPGLYWDFNAKICTARDKLRQENETTPSIDELSRGTKFSCKKIKEIIGGFNACPSPYSTAMQSDGDLADRTIDYEDLADKKRLDVSEQVELRLAYRSIQAWLNINKGTTKALIIQHYFGLNDQEPLNLRQIGLIIGVTRERVRQIKLDAIAELQAYLSITAKDAA